VPNDSQVILSSANKPLSVSRAERSTAAQKEYCLQQGSLSGAVTAPQEREPRGDLQLGMLDAPQIADGESQETHAGILAPVVASRVLR
jgi:hypothetical protein